MTSRNVISNIFPKKANLVSLKKATLEPIPYASKYGKFISFSLTSYLYELCDIKKVVQTCLPDPVLHMWHLLFLYAHFMDELVFLSLYIYRTYVRTYLAIIALTDVPIATITRYCIYQL